MAIQLSTIDTLRDKMKQAPEVLKENRTVSKQDAIRELKRDIEAMQRRGYSIEAIAQFLSDGGLPITTPTLKSYLQRVKAPKQKVAKPVAQANPQASANAKAQPDKTPPLKKPAPPAPAKSVQAKGGFEVRPDSDL